MFLAIFAIDFKTDSDDSALTFNQFLKLHPQQRDLVV